MQISGNSSAVYVARAQQAQQNQTLATASQASGVEGADRENDGDSDDGSVTATRGNKVNLLA